MTGNHEVVPIISDDMEEMTEIGTNAFIEWKKRLVNAYIIYI